MSGFLNYFWREKVEVEKKVEVEESAFMTIGELCCPKSCFESVMNTVETISKRQENDRKVFTIGRFVVTDTVSACCPVTHPVSEICESSGAVSKSLTSASGSKISRKRRFEEVDSDDEEYETPPSSQTTLSPEKCGTGAGEAESLMTRESREYSVPGEVIVECTPEPEENCYILETQLKEICYIPETQLPGLTYTINN